MLSFPLTPTGTYRLRERWYIKGVQSMVEVSCLHKKTHHPNKEGKGMKAKGMCCGEDFIDTSPQKWEEQAMGSIKCL